MRVSPDGRLSRLSPNASNVYRNVPLVRRVEAGHDLGRRRSEHPSGSSKLSRGRGRLPAFFRRRATKVLLDPRDPELFDSRLRSTSFAFDDETLPSELPEAPEISDLESRDSTWPRTGRPEPSPSRARGSSPSPVRDSDEVIESGTTVVIRGKPDNRGSVRPAETWSYPAGRRSSSTLAGNDHHAGPHRRALAWVSQGTLGDPARDAIGRTSLL